MKSVTYLRGGMPILNTVGGDSYKMVQNYGIGYNVLDASMDEMLEKILATKEQELIAMKENARNVFLQKFAK